MIFRICLLSAFLFVAFSRPAASQTTVTFDGSNLKEGDAVTNQFNGVSFTGAIFVLPGSPEFAFNASGGFEDEPSESGTDFTGPFITVADVPSRLSILFDEPVRDVSFLAADLDLTDVLAFVGFDGDDEFLGVRAISDDFPGTGDGQVKLVELPWANIKRVEVRVENRDGGGRWGFDTLRFSIDDILLGDVNQDGKVDLLDVAPFVQLLTNGEFQAEGDINQDGIVDLLDVSPFVELLVG